jgi:2-polyprenyl-6-methoxyphenol hydroxylase-like FAD-dependent oxidoreductase
MEKRTVLISGASVAGPALAYWLRRYGFRPTVVERAPEPREGGQAVDIRGTAREVVERMGLMDAVRRAHTGVHGMAYVDRHDRILARMDPEAFGDSGGAVADLEILRGDLVRILHEATTDGVEYVFDDSIDSLREDDGGVDVTFERSGSRRFDLVVGADGLHSNVRRLAFGPEDLFVTDLGYRLAIFPATTRLRLDGWEHLYAMPRRLAMLYPVGDDGAARAMFFLAARPGAGDPGDVQGQKRLVADAFAGEGWEVPRLLDAMWKASDFYFDRANRVHLDEWSRGRVALLGDAVFGGSVGMGTSMALVGAYVLAGELAAAHGDHRTAFVRYEDELRDYVTACQKPLPGGVRAFLPPTRLEIWLRVQLLRVMTRLPMRGKLTGGMQETANAVGLRDYRDDEVVAGAPAS